MDKKVKELLNDPKTGLTSDLTKLQKMLKENGINMTQKQIKEIRDKQEWHQITYLPKKEKKFNTITVPNNRDSYYMDVMVYNRFKIHEYQYVLNVIDTNSRYVASRALTNMKLKESTRGNKKTTLMDAIEDIMNELGYPRELRCDNQFISDEFVKLMKKHNVKVIYSDPDDVIKNTLVERFNRTLAGLLQKWRVATGKHEWYKVLPELIKKYNNNVHSRIKAKPIDIWNYNDTNKQKIVKLESNLKVNDKVRIINNKKIFDKNDKIRNSKMIYMIVEQVGNKYKVQNIVTKEILKKLYSPRNLLKVDSVDELNEVVETINEPEKKYIGNTIVKSRKNRIKKEEPIKYIGATPIKSRQRKKI